MDENFNPGDLNINFLRHKYINTINYKTIVDRVNHEIINLDKPILKGHKIVFLQDPIITKYQIIKNYIVVSHGKFSYEKIYNLIQDNGCIASKVSKLLSEDQYFKKTKLEIFLGE